MIPVHKVYVPKGIEKGMSEIMYSGQLSVGNYTTKFEKNLSEYVGNEKFITLSQNSILFALQLLGLEKDDEIIASPMSCLMATQQLNVCDLKVKWADIDPNTGTLDPKDVESKITKKTKVILHYHWSGYPGYIDEINSIGKKYNIVIIEDASSAFGSIYKNKKIGNTGSDIVCFSFNPVRIPNAVDGYGIAFNCSALYNEALMFRDLGINRKLFRDDKGEISPYYNVNKKGVSARLNNLSSYIGNQQIKNIDDLLSIHRNNAKKWKSKLKKFNYTYLDENRSYINPNFWTFCFIANNRDELLNEFRNSGYYATKLHFRNDHYTIFGQPKALLGVEKFSTMQLCIPCGWWFENES